MALTLRRSVPTHAKAGRLGGPWPAADPRALHPDGLCDLTQESVHHYLLTIRLHEALRAIRYPWVEAPSFSGGIPPQKTVANPASFTRRSISAGDSQ